MIDFGVDVDASKVVAELDAGIDRLDLPHRLSFLRKTGVRMVRSIQMNFTKEGRPEKWADLSPSTIERRRKGQRKNPKILQDTGRLKNSIAYDVDPAGNQVEVGTNVEYANDMQTGIHPYGKIAARPFVMFQEIDIKRIIDDADREFLKSSR